MLRFFIAALLAGMAILLFALAGIWLESAADSAPYQYSDSFYRQGAALFVTVGVVLGAVAAWLALRRGAAS